jgi:hypothetical protein
MAKSKPMKNVLESYMIKGTDKVVKGKGEHSQPSLVFDRSTLFVHSFIYCTAKILSLACVVDLTESLVSDSSICLGIRNLSIFESRLDSFDMKLNCNGDLAWEIFNVINA